MYFQFACDQCGKQLKVRDELAGRRVRCPYCQHTISVPTESPEAPPAPSFPGITTQSPPSAPTTTTTPTVQAGSKSAPRRQRSSSSEQTDGTNVNLLLSGLIGLGLTAGFCMLMLPFYFGGMFIGELFLDRGWVPFATTFLFAWSLAILYLKARKLRRQRDALLFDLLPNEISPEINAQTVDRFIEHVRSLPVEPGESFLVTRVLRGLEHFRVRRSNPEVASTLTSQSDIDAGSVESSYTILKVFIWAIPILGFIGTVIGISDAVAGFSGNLETSSDPQALKESLNNITGGLATAFDTTLIALVMSLLVMFPASSMQKSEEDLLGAVDEYCNENLIKRLNDGAVAGGRTDNREALQQAIHAAMAAHHAELQTWLTKLEKVGETITNHVGQGWQSIQQSLQAQHDDLLERQQALLAQLHEIQSGIAQFDAAHVEEVRVSMAQLTGGAQEVQQQVAAAMRATAESLDRHFGSLGQGLQSLNQVLESLGEKQVVVQTEMAPRRRGWFSRRNGR